LDGGERSICERVQCIHVSMTAEKTIRISEENREELHELKGVGDSYDDVIARLLEEYRERNRKRLAEKMRETERMDSDELVPLGDG
jgi:predicted CopG family antitoxin